MSLERRELARYNQNRSPMELHLLTSNSMKIEAARVALEPFGIEVVPISLNLPEIQADTNAEIAWVAALEAAKLLRVPVIREDHGFFLNALPGFPGPYMNYIEKTLDPEAALEFLKNKADRTGYFELALAYATPDGKLIEFIDRVPCHIATEIHDGNKDFGWDSIICVDPSVKPLCEQLPQERNTPFIQNFIKLAKVLQSKEK